MEGWLHLLQQCLFNWLHGFATKTGGELWFPAAGNDGNLRYQKVVNEEAFEEKK
jgi:hypothetical protein